MSTKNTKKIKVPRFPRVTVSPERHLALQTEAQKKGVSVAELVEAKFKKAR